MGLVPRQAGRRPYGALASSEAAAAGSRRVAAHDPTRMRRKPPAVEAVNGSWKKATPSATATAGAT